jgi:hypothetical protein
VGGKGQWKSGTITGGANSLFDVYGSELDISGSPAGLGTTLAVGVSQNDGKTPGTVTLDNMTDNLTLTGTGNYISLGRGGTLNLNQSIEAGFQNQEGGIVFDPLHNANSYAINMAVGSTLNRGGAGVGGVPDEIEVGGAINNVGGKVEVSDSTILAIFGQDAAGRSYWQRGTGLLQVDNKASIVANGTYQIDNGTVQLTAPSDGSTADELDGEGLIFGNSNPTNLTIVDNKAGTPGTVSIQGPVTLAAKTTTTMNFAGGAVNAADQLSVSGKLTLNGTLSLKGDKKPTKPLNFFEDTAATPTIAGNFALIEDNVNGTDTGQVVNAPPVEYYQVTIK